MLKVLKKDIGNSSSHRNSFSLIKDDFLHNHVLFTNGLEIYTLNLSSSKTHLVSGSAKGYKEGFGSEAHFNQISCLVTGPNPDGSVLWAAEYESNCIRAINRTTQSSSTVYGNCRSVNDNSASFPHRFIGVFVRSPNDNCSYYFTTDILFTLGCLEVAAEGEVNVTTLYTFHKNITGMAFIDNGQYMYICIMDEIWGYALTINSSPSRLLTNTGEIFIGALIVNQFFLLVVSNTDSLVKGIDLRTRKVKAICSVTDENLVKAECTMRKAIYDIIKHPTEDNSMLIGGRDLNMLSGIQLIHNTSRLCCYGLIFTMLSS